jgi:putative redox protein
VDLITVAHKTGSQFAIRVRGHEVTCDMSVKEGGSDGGPSPVELMAGSLGACIAMMVHRYCQNHGCTDGEVAVSLTPELADDPKRIGSIVVDLEVPKDVPDDRRAAIRRVAELCPVHATLKMPPEVDLDVIARTDP